MHVDSAPREAAVELARRLAAAFADLVRPDRWNGRQAHGFECSKWTVVTTARPPLSGDPALAESPRSTRN
jgi:hypothetical protein